MYPLHARVARIHRTGGPETLVVESVPVGVPGPGEVLLCQTAIGLNFIDTYHRSGLYPLPGLPHGIGVAAAGVVAATGPGVEGIHAGDRVAYFSGPPGAYADWRVVSAARLLKLPEDISDEQAAATLLQGLTVEYLIRRTFAVQPGMTVLWHAAAGGVGLIACQWLKHLGATVIGTVGTPAKAELARQHGCTHTIVYTRENFVARVRELTGDKGVPVVYDSVGKSTFAGSLDCLARRGLLVSFGNASGKPGPIEPLVLAQKGSLYFTRPTLADYTTSREETMTAVEAFFDVLRRGAVRTMIGQRWRLDDVVLAHRALESRQTIGSSLLVP